MFKGKQWIVQFFLVSVASIIICNISLFHRVNPSPPFYSDIVNLSEFTEEYLCAGLRPLPFAPVRITRLGDSALNHSSNYQRYLLTFSSKQAPSPSTVAKLFSIKAVSNITTLRFYRKVLHVRYTTRPNTLVVETIYPVNGLFNASIRWIRIPIFHAKILIENIDRFKENQTAMKCYDGHYYNRRCELWNVCWKWKRFHFYSDTATFFQVRIAYPGSRPVPNDYFSCRIIFRMLAEHTTFNDYEDEIETWYNETSFLTCRWNGMQHFWHVLMDYTVPLYWAMKLHGGVNESNRIFTLDDNSKKKGYEFCGALSHHEIENIRNMSRDRLSCWKHAIIGVPKAERVVQPEKWPNGYDMPYEYPHESVVGMREVFLSHWNPDESNQSITDRCTPDPKHPRVVVTFRAEEKRHIVNKEALLSAMKEWCPECVVDSIYARKHTLREQMNFFCNASLLIGIHGGGLTHMLFMKESTPAAPTSVIEILPYKYTCRDWYRWAAMTAGVRYFHWINNNISNTKPFYGQPTGGCFTGETPCLSDECHDILRDQLTTVDLVSFKKVFMKAINYVSRKSPFDEVDLANQTNETATVY